MTVMEIDITKDGQENEPAKTKVLPLLNKLKKKN